MTNIASPAFLLSVVCLMSISSGCGKKFPEHPDAPSGGEIREYPATPPDKLIEPHALGESPKGKDHRYKAGDSVAIIENNGDFKTEGRIIEKDESGYKVHLGKDRSSADKWFPPSQIFPVPWTASANLKIGDTTYLKPFGKFQPLKCVIKRVPKDGSGSFHIKFENARILENVGKDTVFSSIKPAQRESLSPGDIVYDYFHWAIVIGKRDGKIVVRQANVNAADTAVDVSELLILK